MALEIRMETQRCPLDPAEEQRIRRQLQGLERRLVHFGFPLATIVLDEHQPRRTVTADVRLELTPDTPPLVSHQHAETPDKVVRLAVDDLKRQLERRLSTQRGEPTYGVPSRRLPESLRPHPLSPLPSTEGTDQE